MIDDEPKKELDLEVIKDSPVLKRLIEEVKNEKVLGHTPYNRVYHRHNR